MGWGLSPRQFLLESLHSRRNFLASGGTNRHLVGQRLTFCRQRCRDNQRKEVGQSSGMRRNTRVLKHREGSWNRSRGRSRSWIARQSYMPTWVVRVVTTSRRLLELRKQRQQWDLKLEAWSLTLNATDHLRFFRCPGTATQISFSSMNRMFIVAITWKKSHKSREERKIESFRRLGGERIRLEFLEFSRKRNWRRWRVDDLPRQFHAKS